MPQRASKPWDFVLDLDPVGPQPRFVQIAQALSKGVRSGRLKPGDMLPSSRALAETLGVHRNTVLAAYQELESEGWIATEPAVGTYVSRSIPADLARPFATRGRAVPESQEALGFTLPPPPIRYEVRQYAPGTLVMGSGTPDARLIPIDELARAYRRALKIGGQALLNYGDPRGHERLRTALAAMLSSRRGLSVRTENVLVTRGSQMALDLVARTLLRPGDTVAVEALGYRPAWEALRLTGAELIPLPVDERGLDVDALEAVMQQRPLRALYVTPHHQYPTTVTLDPGRRLRLLELARQHGIAILEDDYDHEFHYEGRPVTPLASSDRHGVVVYVGTMSKILAPGLRLGFVAAPTALIERIAELRVHVDRQGDLAQEYAVAQLLEDGILQRHVWRVGREYAVRREALAEALERQFGDRVAFRLPAGGLALWVNTDPSLDVRAWSERGLSHGVAFMPGQRFSFSEDNLSYLRLGFAMLTPAELAEAVRRMAIAAQS